MKQQGDAAQTERKGLIDSMGVWRNDRKGSYLSWILQLIFSY